MGIENAESGRRTLLRVAAHHLHPDAYPQHGTAQIAYHRVESAGTKIGGSGPGVTHSGEKHTIGPPQFRRVGGENPSGPEPREGIGDRPDISCIIIHNRYHSTPLLDGKE